MPVDKGWLQRAAGIVGADGLLTEPADLESCSHDEYALPSYVQAPMAVLKPSTEEQVAELVRLCADTGAKLIGF